ncbi:hypothetical protein SAMN05660742_103158 [Propionispira arboris]|uniref:Zinc-ribbon domain-containing protein n=1 Tax=Propionispira arboris TaxID=84035 RepID=A0A1H6WCF5_9FIRM|nr:hypothetical protein [Propionispira arboris]SEJ10005.1 hypothetical protein SAMN05660742_103158 [Propionispira arboris]
MKCKYCGTDLAPKETLCHHCGRYLGDLEQAAKSHKKRTMYIGFGIIIIALIFVFTTFGGNLMTQKQTNETLAKQAANAAPNLGLTFKKFKEQFNDSEYTKKFALSLGDVNDKGDDFQYALNPNLLISGAIDKTTRKLIHVQIMAQPSSQDDLIKFVTSMGVVIDIMSPDVPRNKRKDILNELGFGEGADIRQADNDSIRGDKKYHFKYIEKTGFVFSVMNANAK